MIRNKFICFVCGWSIHPNKNDGNFASCATRNDAVSRHFFFRMDTSITYGRRKGQKLAFKTKQTYNVISVKLKPNKRHYLLNQWTFFRNKYT
jgi:hypothetical protein